MSVKDKILKLNSELPSNIKLVAVSKFNPVSKIEQAYMAGQRIFAESRPQELLTKVGELPNDIQWHFIGHLQTNKLKMVLPYVSLIHSVDSQKLLDSIQNWAELNDRTISVLLELHIAQEESKQGLNSSEILQILDSAESQYKNINFCGLMGMASFTDNKDQVSLEFSHINMLFTQIKNTHRELSNFTELSIGMSGDYHIAIEHGSTMVRIGTYIFGDRT